MARAILIMFLSSLTIIGLYDILKFLKSVILKPNKTNFSVVLPITGSDEDVEFKIRSLTSFGEIKNCSCNLIIADMGMDFETLQTCYAIAKQDNKIIVCNPQEIKYFTCNSTY